MLQRQLQWGLAVLVMGIDICATIEKDLNNFQISLLRSPMQRSPTIVVPQVRICATIEKKLRKVRISL